MTIKQLYSTLLSTYTQENLHRITAKIINLQKNKQYRDILEIMSIVAEYTKENEEQYNKAFYKLMMIYHPDRLTHFIAEIERHFASNDREQLHRYSHIVPVIALEQTLDIRPTAPLADPAMERYEWEDPGDGFDVRDAEDGDTDLDEPIAGDRDDTEPLTDFFTVFKRIIYGHENIELPTHYLEDIDIIDLSGYEITDIDGIRFCRHLVSLDLSNNSIVDITELEHLSRLTELYLADNRIGYIDGLEYLTHLRIVDLSNNSIDDISPLFGLEHLEYVNLVGNRISEAQAAALVNNGVMIIR